MLDKQNFKCMPNNVKKNTSKDLVSAVSKVLCTVSSFNRAFDGLQIDQSSEKFSSRCSVIRQKQWFRMLSTVFEHDRVVSSTQKNFRARDNFHKCHF